MKPFVQLFFSFTIVLSVFFSWAHSAEAVISNGANAVDLLGQYTDFSAQTPIYTIDNENNKPNKGLLSLTGDQGGIAVDRTNHRLFVSDPNHNRVLVFNLDSSNILVDKEADNVLGQSNFYSSGNGDTSSSFRGPDNLALDEINSRLFVVENSGNRIKVFDVASISDGEAATHVIGQASFAGSSSANTQTGLNTPRGVAYDSANSRLFVSESFGGNKVKVYEVPPSADFSQFSEPATNVIGQYSYSGTTGSSTQAGLNNPFAIAFDSATLRLFVAESSGNSVKIYDTGTTSTAFAEFAEPATQVIGQASWTASSVGNTQTGLNSPTGLTFDPNNNRLFVAELRKVKVFDVTAGTVSEFSEPATHILGQTLFTTTTLSDAQAGLRDARTLGYDATNDYLYVVEVSTERIRIFDVATSTITNGASAIDQIGQYTDSQSLTPLYGYQTSESTANDLGFDHPQGGVVVDSVGHRLFVSDTGNNRILVYNLNSSNILEDKYPDYVLGQTTFYGTTGAATAAGLFSPKGLAYDSANGRLFVADNSYNRVKVFDVAAITNGEDAVNVLGQYTFTASSASTTRAGMSGPQGVAYDSVNNRLFVSEVNTSRVKVFDVAAITNGEPAIAVIGQSSYTANSQVTSQTGMFNPNGLVYDSATSRLFVAIDGSSRVNVYNVAPGSLAEFSQPAIAAIGQPDYTTNTAGSTQTKLYGVNGLTFDSVNSRLFVAEYSSVTGNRVKVFDVAPANLATFSQPAINILGTNSYTSAASSGLNTQSTLYGPDGIFYDETTKKLYVSEYYGNRMKVFDAEAFLISNIASSTDTTSATITFTTNSTATTTIAYGLTTSYGATTSISSAATSHSVTITGLTLGTVYHFRITAGDTLGNVTSSSDYTFTTSGLTISAPTVTVQAATSVGTSTAILNGTITADNNASTTIRGFNYGLSTSYGSVASTTGTFALGTFSETLTGLTPETTYHFQAYGTNSGGTGTSSDLTFTTDALPDTTGPVISDVASTTDVTTAIIEWTTNENATSSVEYGTTMSFGSATSSEVSDTSHTLYISGLTDNTLYYFRVSSGDASHNYSTSTTYTFRTLDGTGPIISSVASTTDVTTANIEWTTDEASDSFVYYGISSGSYNLSTSSSSYVTSHDIDVINLSADTLYYFVVVSRDVSGNYATSSEGTFFTTSAPDIISPVILSVASTTNVTTASVTWTTDESADSKVSYGTGSGVYTQSTTSIAATTNHSLGLTSLSASTLYYFVVVSSDASGNTATSSEYTLRTTAAPDITAPLISDVASTTGETTATITWTTNENATSTVFYGPSTSYGSASSSESFETSHSITITGLTEGMEYHFQVASGDASYNFASSSDYIFTTDDSVILDTTAPIISGVTEVPYETSVVITWSSDESGSGRVDLGVSNAYGISSTSASSVTSHSIEMASLNKCTFYRYQVSTTDSSLNVGTSSGSFSTLGCPEVEYNKGIYDEENDEDKDEDDVISENEENKIVTAKLQSIISSLINQITLIMEARGLVFTMPLLGEPINETVGFNRDLEVGSVGDDVKMLQQYLNKNGFMVSVSGPGSEGNETNLFGAGTKAALIKFQQANGITPASGYFGPKTRAFVK